MSKTHGAESGRTMFKSDNFHLISDDELGHIPGRIVCQAAWAVKQGVGENEISAFVARKYCGFEKVSHDISDGILTVSYTALDI